MVGIAALHQHPVRHPRRRLPGRARARTAGSARRRGSLAKVLTGFPSILAGVFAYAVVVLATGTYSAPAGGVALAVLMLPTVVLTAEEAMKMVPRRS